MRANDPQQTVIHVRELSHISQLYNTLAYQKHIQYGMLSTKQMYQQYATYQ